LFGNKLFKDFYDTLINMVIGFVLINTAPTYEHEVYVSLCKNERIKEINPLFGEYDLIVKVDADDFQSIGDIVINDIRSLNGVIDTKTLTGTNF